MRLATAGLALAWAAAWTLKAWAAAPAPGGEQCSAHDSGLSAHQLQLRATLRRDWFARELAEYARKPGPHKAMYVDADPRNDGIAVGWVWSAATVGDAEPKAKAYCEEYRKQHGYTKGDCILVAVDDSIVSDVVDRNFCGSSTSGYQQRHSTNTSAAAAARPARLSPGIHYSSRGQYVTHRNGRLTYQVWVTNDGQVAVSCTTTVKGAVPGLQHAQASQATGIDTGASVQTVYVVAKTAFISPGHTVVFKAMRDTMPESATYSVSCFPRR